MTVIFKPNQSYTDSLARAEFLCNVIDAVNAHRARTNKSRRLIHNIDISKDVGDGFKNVTFYALGKNYRMSWALNTYSDLVTSSDLVVYGDIDDDHTNSDTRRWLVKQPLGEPYSNRWISYIVDVGKRTFVNCGPVNGAIIESTTRWHTVPRARRLTHSETIFVKHLTNIRVDKDGVLPNDIGGISYTHTMTFQDRGIRLKISLPEYSESIDADDSVVRQHKNPFVGINRLDDGVDDTVTLHPEILQDAIPDLVIDLTKPFPIADDDFMIMMGLVQGLR